MLSSAVRAILIGGSSHSGKSTLAAALGARTGWTHISTDSLARHPGRPWVVEMPEGLRAVKPHVAAHYRDLSVDELISDVLQHYKSLWPDIQALVSSHSEDTSKDKLVLEGSALWPEEVATLPAEGVVAVWLTAPDELFDVRIKRSSRYEACDTQARHLIDKFLARTLQYNELMLASLAAHGLRTLKVSHDTSVEALARQVQNLAV